MKRMKGICSGLLCVTLLLGCLGALSSLAVNAENDAEKEKEEQIQGSSDDGSQDFSVLGKVAETGGSAQEQTGSDASGKSSTSDDEGNGILQTVAELAPPSTSAACAVLINGTGDTLFAQNENEKAYPASTTKIMTALVVLETLDELGLGTDSEVTVPAEAVGIEGSSIYLKKGERLSIEELLYGLMLQSGNDSAAALAICVGGSLSDFVEKMNEKAAELGCTGTHFTNPSGLYDENHYTTAADLAKIALATMQREDFRSIVGTKNWQNENGSRSFYNKNKTIHQYEGATGVKIGFTKASGRTLVASAERDGKEMIAVVLRDGNWFEDAYALMDYGFAVSGSGEQKQTKD